MTFVSSEDYSQSKSFMVKGSRSSVKKKKKKISKTLIITNRFTVVMITKPLKTNDILGLR